MFVLTARARSLLIRLGSCAIHVFSLVFSFINDAITFVLPLSHARSHGDARPIATLSLEAQEIHEKSEKIYKEKEY